MRTARLLLTRTPAPTLDGVRPPASLTRTRAPGSLRAEGRPLVSVVSVVRNAEETLDRSIRSLREQTYPSIEHLLIDGASTDGTLDVIKSHADWVAAWSSEPDGGLYDAMNRGIASATGDIIAILNADDWYEPGLVEAAVNELERSGADFSFGDIWMHGYRGQDFRLKGDPDYAHVVRRDVPHTWHTTMMCKRSVYEGAGLYRTDMQVAADYDWQIRVFNSGFRGSYAPDAVAHVTAGGVSTARQSTALKEGFVCSVRNGYPVYKALPHWSYRWLANAHPNLHGRLHRLKAKTKAAAASGRERVATKAQSAWKALGPVRKALPGKSVALRVLGVAPEGPAATVTPTPTPEPTANGAKKRAGLAPEVKLAAFVESRHQGETLPERAIEVLVERSVRWKWVRFQGDHPAGASVRALARSRGLEVIGPDDVPAGPGLDATLDEVLDDSEGPSLPDSDRLVLAQTPPKGAVKLNDELCLIPRAPKGPSQ
ncbi:MAG: glycosyltransferase family 2 protein [Planctomycetota bacterium]